MGCEIVVFHWNIHDILQNSLSTSWNVRATFYAKIKKAKSLMKRYGLSVSLLVIMANNALSYLKPAGSIRVPVFSLWPSWNYNTGYWEKFHLVELNILVQNSSKPTKKIIYFLTFRPLSEACDKLVSSQESGRMYDWVGSSLRPGSWIVDLPSGYELPPWSIW